MYILWFQVAWINCIQHGTICIFSSKALDDFINMPWIPSQLPLDSSTLHLQVVNWSSIMVVVVVAFAKDEGAIPAVNAPAPVDVVFGAANSSTTTPTAAAAHSSTTTAGCHFSTTPASTSSTPNSASKHLLVYGSVAARLLLWCGFVQRWSYRRYAIWRCWCQCFWSFFTILLSLLMQKNSMQMQCNHGQSQVTSE